MKLLSALTWIFWRAARIVILFAIVAAALLAFSPRAREVARYRIGEIRPEHVDDHAGLLSRADRGRMDVYLDRIEKETGIEVHLLFMSPPSGTTLEQFAAERASRLGIGRERGGLHGLLVVYDPAAQRLRVELGYGLEEYFPDSFIGYLIERHAASFFQAGDPTTGLRLMIRILHERMRHHMMGGRFDATPLLGRERAEYVSGGAGASGAAPLRPRGPLPREVDGFHRALDPELKRYFGPQPTPEAAFLRYLEWIAADRYDPYVGLLTGPSQEYLAALPMTPAYHDHMLVQYSNEQYRIAERGDLAMLYFTSTPLISPPFLRRDAGGWRVDVVEEVLNTREYAGGWATWGLQNGGETYRRFEDLFVDFGGGLVRVADGDNRPLPTPEMQRRREERAKSRRGAGREFPPELLAEPALPVRDAFGYPALEVDKREPIRLLRERRFDELAHSLARRQQAAERDFRNELLLWEAYRSFGRTSPDLEPILDEWVGQQPRSPEARIARGEYRFALAWESRGTRYIRDTPIANIQRMQRHAAAALEDLRTALRLDSAQLHAYAAAIRVLQLVGARDEARELLRRGLEIAPHSYVLRYEMSFLLRPEWGGSYRELAELAREAERFAEVNPRLRTLAGLVHVARGDAYGRRREPEQALQEYTRALDYGESWLAWLERAEAYRRLGQEEKALADLSRAWVLRPYDPRILESRARTYAGLGKQAGRSQRRMLLERAERDISLAFEIQPDNDRAQLLAHIRVCLGGPSHCD